MPIYRFKCSCGDVEEGLFKIDETPPCPKCGSEKRTKVPCKFSSIIPPWMTDQGREATMRQREYNLSEAGRAERANDTHVHSVNAGDEWQPYDAISDDESEILGTEANPGRIGPDNDFPNLHMLGGDEVVQVP